MAQNEATPLKKAVEHLNQALASYHKRNGDDEPPFLTVTKAFEVAVEYGWRLLKRRVENEGLEAPSPKAAIRAAAKIGIVSDASAWLEAIEARNASVHDYFGIGEKEFVELSAEFANVVQKLI
jgi:nucleotidyltransferase substrate binding protein (TIGR01987 family)